MMVVPVITGALGLSGTPGRDLWMPLFGILVAEVPLRVLEFRSLLPWPSPGSSATLSLNDTKGRSNSYNKAVKTEKHPTSLVQLYKRRIYHPATIAFSFRSTISKSNIPNYLYQNVHERDLPYLL